MVNYKDVTIEGEDYAITEQLGAGNFSTAYLALHKGTSTQFTVKEYGVRFQYALNALAIFRRVAIGPPHIARYLARNAEKSLILQDYIPGKNLDQIKAQKQEYTPGELVIIARQLIAAAFALADEGLCHGDIKAANIVSDESTYTLIGPDGISRIGSLAKADHIHSPVCAAPELIYRGRIAHSTDLFAIGCTLIDLWKDPRIFSTRYSLEVVDPETWRQFSTDMQPIVYGLIQFLHGATLREPDSRFQSAAEAIRALESTP